MKTQYWIKERDNPQLGIYWVACGPMSKTEARKAERPTCGSNIMHAFDTEQAYNARLDELQKNGERVQVRSLKRLVGCGILFPVLSKNKIGVLTQSKHNASLIRHVDGEFYFYDEQPLAGWSAKALREIADAIDRAANPTGGVKNE